MVAKLGLLSTGFFHATLVADGGWNPKTILFER
jgi:hypothetical protein